MSESIILIGAGGHALSVLDSAISSGVKIRGFVDEHKSGSYLGFPILGKSVLEIPHYQNYRYHIAIGNCARRREWFSFLQYHNLELANIIDPTAILSKMASIGVGNYIGKLAVIIAGSSIGDNNLINTKALIEHGCTVHNHSNLSTNSIINGDVNVEDCVFLGSSAICNGQISLGRESTIGSGSVVIRDVAPYCTVAGIPARVIHGRRH